MIINALKFRGIKVKLFAELMHYKIIQVIRLSEIVVILTIAQSIHLIDLYLVFLYRTIRNFRSFIDMSLFVLTM